MDPEERCEGWCTTLYLWRRCRRMYFGKYFCKNLLHAPLIIAHLFGIYCICWLKITFGWSCCMKYRCCWANFLFLCFNFNLTHALNQLASRNIASNPSGIWVSRAFYIKNCKKNYWVWKAEFIFLNILSRFNAQKSVFLCVCLYLN